MIKKLSIAEIIARTEKCTTKTVDKYFASWIHWGKSEISFPSGMVGKLYCEKCRGGFRYTYYVQEYTTEHYNWIDDDHCIKEIEHYMSVRDGFVSDDDIRNYTVDECVQRYGDMIREEKAYLAKFYR